MLTDEQIQQLESLSYFWDRNGSWVIQESHTRMFRLSVQFPGPSGPGVTELVRMRQLLPELGEMSPADAKGKLGNSNVYLIGDFAGLAGQRLIRHGHDLGLKVLVRKWNHVFCNPYHMDGTAPLIMDDEEELRYVIQKMREADRPVVIIEED